MGWLSDKKDNAKDKAKELAKAPVVKVKDAAVEKYYRSKGKWKKGECGHCGRPIEAGKTGFMHPKCAKAAKETVAGMKSSHNIRNTVHCQTCGTNINTTHSWNRPDCCKNE
jgi:endogenous inhibitor of DNA gyrase (YacG/DUF329 family)